MKTKINCYYYLLPSILNLKTFSFCYMWMNVIDRSAPGLLERIHYVYLVCIFTWNNILDGHDAKSPGIYFSSW